MGWKCAHKLGRGKLWVGSLLTLLLVLAVLLVMRVGVTGLCYYRQYALLSLLLPSILCHYYHCWSRRGDL